MPKEKTKLDVIMDLMVRRGFITQTAEIYNNGLAGFFDYCPIGTQFKRNIEDAWRDFFIHASWEAPVHEIEGSVVLPEEVLVASGHVSSFSDPLVSCEKCDAQHRADQLAESALSKKVEGMSIGQIQELIVSNGVSCPDCGGSLAPVQEFNLMLKTDVGPAKNAKRAYLRPETAQSIFADFKRVSTTMRAKLPFGIAQVGNSYRNEISPRQGLIRLRGFTQMEIEFFFDPEDPHHPDYSSAKDTKFRLITREAQATEQPHEVTDLTVDEALQRGIFQNDIQAYFVGKTFEFYQSIGIPYESLRFRHMLNEETPFYSKGNFDLEIELSLGWKEAVGIAYRTDHDLSTHARHSGEKLEMDVQSPGKPVRKVVPHVVEPSFGVERALYSILEHVHRPAIPKDSEKHDASDREWDWFQVPARVAPFSAMVFPLMKKPELVDPAMELYKGLKRDGIHVFFDKSGAIGRRYARADEIGTPYCFTIDYQTVEDGTVTIRDRDSMQQVRVPLAGCASTLRALLSDEKRFTGLGTPLP